MRKCAGNDVLELYAVTSSDTFSRDRATIMHHDRQTQDQRMKLLVEFTKMMMHTHVMMKQVEGAAEVEVSQEVNTQAIVMTAAALVDSLWDEGTRRGWIFSIPAFPDAFGADKE